MRADARQAHAEACLYARSRPSRPSASRKRLELRKGSEATSERRQPRNRATHTPHRLSLLGPLDPEIAVGAARIKERRARGGRAKRKGNRNRSAAARRAREANPSTRSIKIYPLHRIHSAHPVPASPNLPVIDLTILRDARNA